MYNNTQLLNSSGAIDVSSAGYKIVIDTMTHIRQGVIEQKFYEIEVGDYLPIDRGTSAWSEEIVQNISFAVGGDFFEGDIDTTNGNGRIASVDAGFSKLRMPVETWGKTVSWTIMEIEKAARAMNWDVVESKLWALRKNWLLGIQEVAFLGHPVITDMTGLLNDPDVTVNTTVINEPISDMDEGDFQNFVREVLGAYFANSGRTRMPSKFVMPTDDYLGLGAAASATFPNVTKVDYLANFFRRMTRNENFEILPLAYADAEENKARGLNVNRYVLYRDDPDTLTMSIPVEFTFLAPGTSNNMQWTQPAYGQYSGTLINRKPEVLYFDETAVS